MSERKPPSTREIPEMPEDELPPTEEEVAASNRLRDALDNPGVENPDADLARSLRAAWSPDAIDDDELRAIAEGSIEKDELAAAAALRDALEGKAGARSPDADLARSLAAAWSPKALSDADHTAIVMKALDGMARVIPIQPRGRVIRVAFGVTSVLALAAGLVLLVRSAPTPGAQPELAKARSTQPLFSEPFKANPSGSGEASARIDRIALARASDYRDNRFAKWGVR